MLRLLFLLLCLLPSLLAAQSVSLESISDARSRGNVQALNDIEAALLARPERTGEYYRLIMALCYAKMQFGDYLGSGSLVARHLPDLRAWQPSSDDEHEVRANLYHIYGQYLTRERRVAEAVQYFLDAEAIFRTLDTAHPSLFSVHVILGEALINVGLYERALSTLAQAQQLVPAGRDDGVSYLASLQITAYTGSGQLDQAQQVIDQYWQNPVDPRVDYFLYFQQASAELAFAQGQHELALAKLALIEPLINDHLDQSLKARWWQLKGDVLQAQGQIRASQVAYDYLLTDLDSSGYLVDSDVYRAMSQNYASQGLWQQAYQASQHYAELEVALGRLANSVEVVQLDAIRQLNDSRQQAALAQAQVQLLATSASQARLATWLALVSIALLAVLLLFVWRRWHHRLRRFGYEDELTGLGNRRALYQGWRAPYTGCLVIGDIDGLKQVNDEQGHLAGDQLIRLFGQALATMAERHHGQVCRIGGDEFALLIKPIDAATLARAMDEVVQRVHDAGYQQTDLSYGHVDCQAVRSISWAMAKADAAMYAMKSARKRSRARRGA